MARLTVVLDDKLFADFKRIADERGHTMTWYVTQSIKEVVNASRREEETKGGEARQEQKRVRKSRKQTKK